MTLHAILKAIQDDGQARAHEIEEQAQVQARELLADMQLQAAQELEKARTVATFPATRERARILHHARLEVLRIVGDVSETLVDKALDQTRGHLANIRSNASYSAILRCLTEEAFAELNVSLEKIGNSSVEADARDRDILENILFDMGLDLPVNYKLNSWGGLIVRSDDSRVVIINTLEARFERSTSYLRRYLAALFEEGQSESMATEKMRLLQVSKGQT
jgi:vacuolar-type H+-ATPase subunit E/Vma4